MQTDQEQGCALRPATTSWLLALALSISGCTAEQAVGQAPALVEGDLAASHEPLSPASSPDPRTPCSPGVDPWILPLSPAAAPGEPVRLLVVSERPLAGLHLEDENGRPLRETTILGQGPSHALLFEGRAPRRAAPARFLLRAAAPGPDGVPPAPLACAEVPAIAGEVPTSRAAPPSGIWDIRRDWDERWERVFSAWVAWLFRPLPGQAEAWRPLQQALRDPARNFLYDVLGLCEDSGRVFGSRRAPRVIAWADCGDTPYQLRAYFAWKHGLPFRYRRCDRGSGVRGPRCPLQRDNRYGVFDHLRDPVERFNAFLREGLAWQVHSGTTRTLPEDEASDFYPIRLSRETIRPGTIFVDVGGHVFVMTQWDAEGLFAVDGHPDFSVTRRPFSESRFRYFRGTRTGGFKAFRPLRLVGGALVPLPNQAVSSSFSVEQYRFGTGRDFHQAMARMLVARHPG